VLTTNYAPTVSGYIRRINVDIGDSVRSGETLAQSHDATRIPAGG
jgi:multidrug resistance efflux pump